MGIHYDDGGFLTVGYTVEEVEFTYSYWDDTVGYNLSCVAKKIPSSFNYNNFATWEKIGPLLKIENENKIEYNSRESEIRGLKIDE